MGLFDEYEPNPPVACPTCGGALEGFQGKDAECALLVWRQGVAAPVAQSGDEGWNLAAAALSTLRLPERFELYSACERCGHLVFFTGFCSEGIWTETVLGSHLSVGPTIPAHSVAPNWRQCTRCTEAWEHSDATIRAGCPSCHALTRLEPR